VNLKINDTLESKVNLIKRVTQRETVNLRSPDTRNNRVNHKIILKGVNIMQTTTLKNLSNIYTDSQEFRIRAANRISHCSEDETTVKEKLESFDPNKAYKVFMKDIRGDSKKVMSINDVDAANILSKETITKEEALALIEFTGSSVNSIYDRAIFSDAFSIAGHEMIKEYTRVEKGIAVMIENELIQHPISKWLTAQVGIGPVLAGGLIGYIEPVLPNLTYAQSLWKYSGYAVVEMCETCGKRFEPQGSRAKWIMRTADRLKTQNDKLKDGTKKKKGDAFIKEAESMLCHCEHPVLHPVGQRRVKGQLADFNPELKRLCYLVGDQFIKQTKSPYRKIYDQARLEYENRPDLMKERDERKGGLSKGTAHINAMARRKTIKIFLSHLWQEWRRLEGLPTPDPYAIAMLGHGNKVEPFVTLEDVGLTPKSQRGN
jgi:hypothetical protein